MSEIDGYRQQIAGYTPVQVLVWAADVFGLDGLTMASSLGAEDQVLTHMASEALPGLSIFTLDTGRLFQESYDLIDETRTTLGIQVVPYFPDAAAVEAMVADRGVNLFYDSVEDRKRCCGVRKVEPLKRALGGKTAWIVGLRREQSVTRDAVETLSWDESNGMYKVSPLADWSSDMVWDYIRTHQVPYNRLHDRGFPSIGCLPCTRAVKPGEEERAGRWWWEHPEHKECGLHLSGAPQTTSTFSFQSVALNRDPDPDSDSDKG